MRSKASSSLFLRAYNVARAARVLEVPWFRRGFLFSYSMYKRWYEDPFWNLARRSPQLFADGDVLDIGANVGYTAAVFARAVRPGAKVYAFEPDAQSFAELQEAVRRKKLAERVEILNLAVGANNGEVDFWHNEEHAADHRVATERFKSSEIPGAQVRKVAMTSVDNFVRQRGLQSVAFVKIDVQGYELAVCEGMTETLARFPQASVCFEYAPEGMRELGFEPPKLLRFFRDAKYQIHILTRSAAMPAKEDRAIEEAAVRGGYVDLLCSRKALG